MVESMKKYDVLSFVYSQSIISKYTFPDTLLYIQTIDKMLENKSWQSRSVLAESIMQEQGQRLNQLIEGEDLQYHFQKVIDCYMYYSHRPIHFGAKTFQTLMRHRKYSQAFEYQQIKNDFPLPKLSPSQALSDTFTSFNILSQESPIEQSDLFIDLHSELIKYGGISSKLSLKDLDNQFHLNKYNPFKKKNKNRYLTNNTSIVKSVSTKKIYSKRTLKRGQCSIKSLQNESTFCTLKNIKIQKTSQEKKFKKQINRLKEQIKKQKQALIKKFKITALKINRNNKLIKKKKQLIQII